MHPDFYISDDIFTLVEYGFEPIEIEPRNAFRCYKLQSGDEFLQISFNGIERWVKVIIGMLNDVKSTLLIENAQSLTVHKPYSKQEVSLIIEADYLTGELALFVHVLPSISINLSIMEIHNS